MAKLHQLFDLHKISDNKDLHNVINDTHSRYSSAVELGDDELEMVAAGSFTDTSRVQYMKFACPNCGEIQNVDVMKDSFKCKKCGKTTEMH